MPSSIENAAAGAAAEMKRLVKENANLWARYESDTARLEREKQAIINEAAKKQNTLRRECGKMAATALKEHKKLEDKLAAALADNEELRQENDHLDENRNLYSVQLQGLDEIEVENDQLKNRVEWLETRNDDLQALNDEMQERIALWNSEYDDLKGAKEESDPLVRHWETKVKELTDEVAPLRFIVENQTDVGEDLPPTKEGGDPVGPHKSKIKELNEGAKSMRFIAKTQERYENLFTANNTNKSTISQYEADMALMKQQYDDLEAAKGGTDAVVAPYKTELKKLNNEIRELNAEAVMLRTVAENMTKKWKDSCTASETNIGTIFQYKSEVALMKQQYEDMVEDKDEVIGKFSERIAKLNDEVSGLNARVKQLEMTRDQAKDFIAEHNILIKGQQTALDTQDATIKTQNDSIVNHTTTIERQRQQLENKREEVDAKTAHIEVLNGMLDSKDEEISDLKNNIGKLKGEVDNLEGWIARLRTEEEDSTLTPE